jgi:hypothetical protein
MQARGDRTPGVADRQRPQNLPRRHPLIDQRRRPYRLVRGPQPASVVHAHDTTPGHEAGVRDDPTTRGQHRLTLTASEIHTAMSGQPR